jgi:hypothetical protein
MAGALGIVRPYGSIIPQSLGQQLQAHAMPDLWPSSRRLLQDRQRHGALLAR